MAEQQHASLMSPGPIPSFGGSGVKCRDTELCSSGNVFWRVMNHVSLFGGQMGKYGFRETASLHCPNCKVWWRRDNDMGFQGLGWAPYLQ